MTRRGGTHTRNRQGEGARLRRTILDAASRILEDTGSDDALTLRAVAREAGITAPAIYAHFADRDELRTTVVQDTFAELTVALRAALDAAGHDDPVERLRDVCRAYLEFAAQRPHHYRVLFERHRATPPPPSETPPSETPPSGTGAASGGLPSVGGDAFGVLLAATAECIDAGRSAAQAAGPAAVRVWVGLHGQATLRASVPWFPWPDSAHLAEELMTRLADLRD